MLQQGTPCLCSSGGVHTCAPEGDPMPMHLWTAPDLVGYQKKKKDLKLGKEHINRNMGKWGRDLVDTIVFQHTFV